MAERPVIVGVDSTPAGVLAATVGCSVAEVSRAPCRIVHAVRSPQSLPRGQLQTVPGPDALERFLEAARAALARELAAHVPAERLGDLTVRFGNPAWVLREVARETDARLVVLGGKHHPAAVRWFGGSTAHHVVRTIDLPLLVTATAASRFERVLVATDLSESAAATLAAAREFASLFGARLRVLTVVEPLPSIPDVAVQLDEGEHLHYAQQELASLLAGLDGGDRMELSVQLGSPARTISDEAEAWRADLVVVGSHGKGWVDRVLLGSTTERLLNRLPCSILVLPVRGPATG